MTTFEITLPDGLVEEASGAGLLASAAIERLQEARATLATKPQEAMTRQEINEEISAYRKGQRLAVGS